MQFSLRTASFLHMGKDLLLIPGKNGYNSRTEEVRGMTERVQTEQIPRDGLALVNQLRSAGYEAWFVGGCVRDLLMGNEPNDWDICTSAKPEQTKAVFADYRIHETGIKHGTVLVMSGGAGYEITTYRTEREYSDHRRPDRVEFISELSGDLARRDFTVNAMAYHPDDGVVDLYGGIADLQQGVIRAVGNPEERFKEDALRMMRALRFAGRFSFAIESKTAAAIHQRRKDLHYIAAERLFSELKGILLAPKVSKLLEEFSDLVSEILPELVPMFGFDQQNPHHDADCWQHTLRVVDGVPPNSTLRLAALFHDAGKPGCFRVDEQGIGHFTDHAKYSGQLVHQALMRLKCDRETRQTVETLVLIHDDILPHTSSGVRRFLAKRGRGMAEQLISLRRSDILGQSDYQRREKLAQVERFEQLLSDEIKKDSCLTLKQLDISGADLIESGIPAGPQVGRLLQIALNGVLDGAVSNQREELLDYIKGM